MRAAAASAGRNARRPQRVADACVRVQRGQTRERAAQKGSAPACVNIFRRRIGRRGARQPARRVPRAAACASRAASAACGACAAARARQQGRRAHGSAHAHARRETQTSGERGLARNGGDAAPPPAASGAHSDHAVPVTLSPPAGPAPPQQHTPRKRGCENGHFRTFPPFLRPHRPSRPRHHNSACSKADARLLSWRLLGAPPAPNAARRRQQRQRRQPAAGRLVGAAAACAWPKTARASSGGIPHHRPHALGQRARHRRRRHGRLHLRGHAHAAHGAATERGGLGGGGGMRACVG
jgi:hypothetical protein